MSFLYMHQGNVRHFPVVVTNPDGTPMDLTTATLRWVAKTLRTEDAPIILQKVSTDSAQITIDADPTTGLAEIHILRADTVDFEGDKRLYWELQVTRGNEPLVVDEGRLYVYAGIVTTAP